MTTLQGEKKGFLESQCGAHPKFDIHNYDQQFMFVTKSKLSSDK